MKKFLLLLIIPFLIFCQNNNNLKLPLTEIEFHSKTWNMGEISEGEIIETFFTFKNIGTKPLLISNAKAGCGCTVPKWSKAPIPPGENGYIQVTFNSKGKPGPQNKLISLTTNTNPNIHKLRVVGKVVP